MGNFEWNPYSVFLLLLLLTIAVLSLVLVLSFSLYLFRHAMQLEAKVYWVRFAVIGCNFAHSHRHTHTTNFIYIIFYRSDRFIAAQRGKMFIFCSETTNTKSNSPANAMPRTAQTHTHTHTSVNGFLQSDYYCCCCCCIFMCFILISDAMICGPCIFHTPYNDLVFFS